jgi:hypothetical protein
MKAIVGVISALVIVGIAALFLLRAQQSYLLTDHAAGTASRVQGTPPAQSSDSMTPWPDLNDVLTDDSRPTGTASLDGSVPRSTFIPDTKTEAGRKPRGEKRDHEPPQGR